MEVNAHVNTAQSASVAADARRARQQNAPQDANFTPEPDVKVDLYQRPSREAAVYDSRAHLQTDTGFRIERPFASESTRPVSREVIDHPRSVASKTFSEIADNAAQPSIIDVYV